MSCGKLGANVEKCLHISTNVNKTWNMVVIYSNFGLKSGIRYFTTLSQNKKDGIFIMEKPLIFEGFKVHGTFL